MLQEINLFHKQPQKQEELNLQMEKNRIRKNHAADLKFFMFCNLSYKIIGIMEIRNFIFFMELVFQVDFMENFCGYLGEL